MKKETHNSLNILKDFSIDLIRLKHKAMDLVASTGNEKAIDLRDGINDLINKVSYKGTEILNNSQERLFPIITKEKEMKERYE